MPPHTRFFRLAAVLLPVALAGCGGEEARFPPACPQVRMPADAADLTRYRGGGRDLTDLVLDGRILDAAGKCRRDGPGVLDVTLRVTLSVARGPAAGGRVADVAYFVAVTEGERILDKQIYPVRITFPPNTDRVTVTGDVVDMRIPVTPQKSGAAYQIRVGFQLTPEELALNRARGPR